MPEDLVDPNEDTKADEEIIDKALEKTEEKEEEELRTKETKEEEEEEKEEVEEEKEEEEEEELTGPRPTFKAITSKFPELFKEFPSLRHSFFREQEFSKIFASVDEARETFERSQVFDDMEQSILSGNPAPLLDAIREADTGALTKFVNNFLPALFDNAATKQLYYEAATPIIQNVLRSAFSEGRKNKNANLEYAAQYINEFLFGSLEIKPPEEKKPDPERAKLEQEKLEFYKNRFQELHEAVDKDSENGLRKLVSNELDDSLSPFIREKIIEETISRVDKQVASDPQHMRLMDTLWNKAFRAGMTREFQSRITRAYLERAKPLVSAVRDKVVKEALRAPGSKEEGKYKPHKELVGGPAGTKHSMAGVKAKDIDWNKTTDADVIEAALGGKANVILKKR